MRVRRLLAPFVELREGESTTAALMFAYSFLAMTAYNIVKPVTRSKLIDHTRSFRMNDDLLKPQLLVRLERSLFERLQTLTADEVAKATGSSLTRFEIQAMLKRRDAIVELFKGKIAERGEAAVLFTPRP